MQREQLIKRLREAGERLPLIGDTGTNLHLDAAKEIEHLRSEIEMRKQQVMGAAKVIQEVKDDNSKLREDRDQLNDQLNDRLYKYGCEDIDVIRCLKTLAYEHNHSDVPRYKDFAKRTMDKYVERCTSVGSTLAAHDADVIERALSDEEVRKAMQLVWDDHVSDTGCYPDDFSIDDNGLLYFTAGHYFADRFANQLREQAKGAQS